MQSPNGLLRNCEKWARIICMYWYGTTLNILTRHIFYFFIMVCIHSTNINWVSILCQAETYPRRYEYSLFYSTKTSFVPSQPQHWSRSLASWREESVWNAELENLQLKFICKTETVITRPTVSNILSAWHCTWYTVATQSILVERATKHV